MLRIVRGLSGLTGHAPTILTAIIGALASVAVLLLSLSWERRVATLQFEAKAADHLSVLNTDLQDAAFLLDTLRAYFEASERLMTRDEFMRFSSVLHARTVGLRDTGWAPRVTAAERDRFERAMRAAGAPDFEIREFGPGGKLNRAAERPEYFPIVYLDSGPVTPPVLGLDLSSEPLRRAAIWRAVTTEHSSATPPIRLLTVDHPRGGVMSFAPVYRPAGAGKRSPGSVADGVVFGVFGIGAMVEDIIAAKRRLDGVDVYLFDTSGPMDDRALYWRASPSHPKPAPSETAMRAMPRWEGTVPIFDQQWGALFLPDNGITATPWSARVLAPAAAGLLLTVLATAHRAVSHRRTAELEALTASLRRTTEELRRKGESIAHMARHDALTGLPNRRCFTESLEQAVGRGVAGQGDCAVLQVDLDRFKAVNDQHGHAAGDMVLREVAQRLSAVGAHGATIARLGGDEFAAIVDCREPGAGPAELADGIIAALSKPILCDGFSVEVGASVGIALCPVDGSEPDALLRAADLAMYRAKRGGRGQYCFFQRGIDGERDSARVAA